MSISLGLERISLLLQHLDNPQNKFKSIHVGGTNGKGSTSTIMSYVLANKYKIGVFNSPYFLIEQDSIKINNCIVDDTLYSQSQAAVKKVNSLYKVEATIFEVLTSTAFLCFQQSDVDFAIIEVGLGGRYDATNVINSLVSVICSISIDHTEFLGDTIESIAYHKAGIIKSGEVVVVAKQKFQSSVDVLATEAMKVGAQIVYASNVVKIGEGVQVFYDDESLIVPSLKLKGDFQLENIGAACQALSCLKIQGFILDHNDIINGISDAKIPGRLDQIDSNIYGSILVDGAHNLGACLVLKEYIESIRIKNVAWIVGYSGKKDPKIFRDILYRDGDRFYPVEFSQPLGMPWIKAMDYEIVTEGIGSEFCVDCGGSVKKALNMIDRKCTEQVVVCGSLYLAADLYRILE